MKENKAFVAFGLRNILFCLYINGAAKCMSIIHQPWSNIATPSLGYFIS